jgi:hypothetical protein
MPAIYPSRLKVQAVELAGHYASPGVFVRGLHDLLDFYSDRTYKPGQSGEPRPLIAQYNTPPPVLRQLLIELIPFINQEQQAGLSLSDSLWKEPYLECMRLAVKILGQINPDPPGMILDRVLRWGISRRGYQLQQDLVVEGLDRLRRELPDAYLQRVESWLSSEDFVTEQLSLKALTSLIDQGNFGNLPALYHVVAPLLRSGQSKLRPDIMEVLKTLAERSPQETAVFLKQNLAFKTEHPEILWFVRNSLRFFPPQIEDNLRNSLRGIN